MDLLEVSDVSKTYGSGETAVRALKKVTFSVSKGEYVAIVGESGSGKLTIFRRRNIGFIFQAFNLILELTVEQNIVFPVLLDYRKPDRKYLEELLTVLSPKERWGHLPGRLSGGQQQRVAIGRVLITRSSLILADKPTRNLDTQNNSEVIALLNVSDGIVTDLGRCSA